MTDEIRKRAEEIMAICLGDFVIKDESMFQIRKDIEKALRREREESFEEGYNEGFTDGVAEANPGDIE